MTDTPSTGLRLRDQESGTNLNIWGDYTDSNLAVLDRRLTAAQTITVTGNTTVTFTDYDTSSQYIVSTLKLTGPSGDGTLTAAAIFTMPNVRWTCDVYNVTGQDITFRTAAGGSVVIKTGYQARLQNDATDVLLRSASQFVGGLYVNGQIQNVTAGTANTDAVNKIQMDNAIAAATTSSSPGTFRITASDTTSKFANSAITVSGSLTKSVVSPGGNETLNIDFTFDAGQQAYYQAVYFV
jgi:hypothetical protein